MGRTEALYSRRQFLLDMVQNGQDAYVYFVENRQLVFSETLAETFDIPQVMDRGPEHFVSYNRVYPPCIEEWMGMFSAVDRGTRKGTFHLCLKTKGGMFIRYRVHFHVVFDEQGKPFGALFSCEDEEDAFVSERLRENDIHALRQVTEKVFPEILTMNITRNTYRVIKNESEIGAKVPEDGIIDDMLQEKLNAVAPEDKELFGTRFCVSKIKHDIQTRGEDTWILPYRRLTASGESYWVETILTRQKNVLNNDVLLVAVTRSIDEQKAEELRLREEIRQQNQELQVVMGQLGKRLCHYDIVTKTLVIPPFSVEEKGFPSQMENFPQSILDSPPDCLPPESLEEIRRLWEQIADGLPSGFCEYREEHSSGKTVWMRLEFVTIFNDKQEPVRAVLATEDITDTYEIANERTRLKQNEKILHILTMHSDRNLVYYDLLSRQLCSWDEKIDLSDPQAQEFAPRFRTTFIEAEDQALVGEMMEGIHRGVPYGERKLSVMLKDKGRIWIDLKFSTLFDEDNHPMAAVFSYKDITNLYQYELAWKKHIETMESEQDNCIVVAEFDFSANRVDHVSARGITIAEEWQGNQYTDFVDHLIERGSIYENAMEVTQYFSPNNLIRLFGMGKRKLKRELHARLVREGIYHWLETEMVMVEDSYTGHIRGFFRILDITDVKEKELEIQYRSERDGMTGLLNRETAERKIKESIEKGDSPGILLLLDLDDLKGINDTMGHAEGDRAIRGISDMLRAHFRKTDIVGRLGGDEFVIYLPGGAKSQDAVAMSIAELLRKLSGISIGKKDERRTHCSIGCAIQTPEVHGFDMLYGRADVALYHVKRTGKNSFAFYTPDMEEESQRFKIEKMIAMKNSQGLEFQDMQHMIDALASVYSMIALINLSRDDYYLLQTRKGIFIEEPVYGKLDTFLRMAEADVHPDDREILWDVLSRKRLLDIYGGGGETVVRYFRLMLDGKYCQVRVSIFFHTNESGDVCAFAFLRRINRLETQGLTLV